MRETDRTDLEVHRPDSQTGSPQTRESVRRRAFEGQHVEIAREVNCLLKARIRAELLMDLFEPVDVREPHAQLFFDADDRREKSFTERRLGVGHPLGQSITPRPGLLNKHRQMVRVENDHVASSA